MAALISDAGSLVEEHQSYAGNAVEWSLFDLLTRRRKITIVQQKARMRIRKHCPYCERTHRNSAYLRLTRARAGCARLSLMADRLTDSHNITCTHADHERSGEEGRHLVDHFKHWLHCFTARTRHCAVRRFLAQPSSHTKKISTSKPIPASLPVSSINKIWSRIRRPTAPFHIQPGCSKNKRVSPRCMYGHDFFVTANS